MKPRYAPALALVLVASCAPDMVMIDAATKRSETAANRAERSAEIADVAASHSDDASVRALELAAAAEKSKKRAEDSVSRMEYFDPKSVLGILTIASTTNRCSVLLSGKPSA
jgi:hypothetical protein